MNFLNKVKAWIIANKILSCIIAVAVVAAITLAIVLPVTLGNKTDYDDAGGTDVVEGDGESKDEEQQPSVTGPTVTKEQWEAAFFISKDVEITDNSQVYNDGFLTRTVNAVKQYDFRMPAFSLKTESVSSISSYSYEAIGVGNYEESLFIVYERDDVTERGSIKKALKADDEISFETGTDGGEDIEDNWSAMSKTRTEFDEYFFLDNFGLKNLYSKFKYDENERYYAADNIEIASEESLVCDFKITFKDGKLAKIEYEVDDGYEITKGNASFNYDKTIDINSPDPSLVVYKRLVKIEFDSEKGSVDQDSIYVYDAAEYSASEDLFGDLALKIGGRSITATAYEGYVVEGWYIGDRKIDENVREIYGDVTITVKFAEDTRVKYEVSVEFYFPNAAGSTTPQSKFTVYDGTEYSINGSIIWIDGRMFEAKKDGYKFKNWRINNIDQSGNFASGKISGNTSVLAFFEVDE